MNGLVGRPRAVRTTVGVPGRVQRAPVVVITETKVGFVVGSQPRFVERNRKRVVRYFLVAAKIRTLSAHVVTQSDQIVFDRRRVHLEPVPRGRSGLVRVVRHVKDVRVVQVLREIALVVQYFHVGVVPVVRDHRQV